MICFNEFRDLVFKENNLSISAYAMDYDPFYESLKSIQYIEEPMGNNVIMGAVCLNNVTFVFLFDDQDGYRSVSNELIVISGNKLKTLLPDIKASVKVGDVADWYANKHSDKNNIDESNTTLINIYTKEGLQLFTIGTEYYDPYYPQAIFSADIENINKASIKGLNDKIKKSLKNIEKSKPNTKSKKLI